MPMGINTAKRSRAIFMWHNVNCEKGESSYPQLSCYISAENSPPESTSMRASLHTGAPTAAGVLS